MKESEEEETWLMFDVQATAPSNMSLAHEKQAIPCADEAESPSAVRWFDPHL